MYISIKFSSGRQMCDLHSMERLYAYINKPLKLSSWESAQLMMIQASVGAAQI